MSGHGQTAAACFCQAVIASRVAVQILEDVLRRDKKGLSVMYLSARACSLFWWQVAIAALIVRDWHSRWLFLQPWLEAGVLGCLTLKNTDMAKQPLVCCMPSPFVCSGGPSAPKVKVLLS